MNLLLNQQGIQNAIIVVSTILKNNELGLIMLIMKLFKFDFWEWVVVWICKNNLVVLSYPNKLQIISVLYFGTLLWFHYDVTF